jgi:hypothetical protein
VPVSAEMVQVERSKSAEGTELGLSNEEFFKFE